MEKLEKYNKIFQDCLEVSYEELNENLTYQSINSWDSVGHMSLIAEIEDVFDIMMETEDIIDFNSYEMGKEILKKYEIKL